MVNGNSQSSSDSSSQQNATLSMLYTLAINLVLFIIFFIVFEINRKYKQIFLKRYQKRFIKCDRIPPAPSDSVFGWIYAIFQVEEVDVMHMVGLDAYMLLRFHIVCLKLAIFLSVWGVIVLLPTYGTVDSPLSKWDKYTILNVVQSYDPKNISRIWVPAFFSYLFAAYFCQLLYSEYQHFSNLRLNALMANQDDSVDTYDNPPQKYYTVMLESLPAELRSADMLFKHFDELFPGEVYKVEIALDLRELNSVTNDRNKVRVKLEQAIASYISTSIRPTVLKKNTVFKLFPRGFFAWAENLSLSKEKIISTLKEFLTPQRYGYEYVDAIDFYTKLLIDLNQETMSLQLECFQFAKGLNSKDLVYKLKNRYDTRAAAAVEKGNEVIKKVKRRGIERFLFEESMSANQSTSMPAARSGSAARDSNSTTATAAISATGVSEEEIGSSGGRSLDSVAKKRKVRLSPILSSQQIELEPLSSTINPLVAENSSVSGSSISVTGDVTGIPVSPNDVESQSVNSLVTQNDGMDDKIGPLSPEMDDEEPKESLQTLYSTTKLSSLREHAKIVEKWNEASENELFLQSPQSHGTVMNDSPSLSPLASPATKELGRSLEAYHTPFVSSNNRDDSETYYYHHSNDNNHSNSRNIGNSYENNTINQFSSDTYNPLNDTVRNMSNLGWDDDLPPDYHRPTLGEIVKDKWDHLKSSIVQDPKARDVLEKAKNVGKRGWDQTKMAGVGAIRGVIEMERAIEMLTIGAYYKYSSTAFVTFTSRMAETVAHQMLLSHENPMEVSHAPNPNDVIWENVAIPKSQIMMRNYITNVGLIVGALFWSSLVISINKIAKSLQLPESQQYFLSVLIILLFLLILPFIFDSIARYYEGMKLESEVQNSIMTRYFYYQLMNIFVTVGLGGVNIFEVFVQSMQSPRIFVAIIGDTIPSLSLYFCTMMIAKTFVALPIEMLRPWQLSSILLLGTCMDRKKCTRRELRTGAFYAWPMLYGWIYPQLLMVLMIMVTYACIAPLLMPFGIIFFIFSYLMYKYQLLYVYVNNDQSLGFMWYAVFNRCLIALIFAAVTLLAFLAVHTNDFTTGPFIVCLPLPFGLMYFWHYCDNKFKKTSMDLSFSSAKKIDNRSKARKAQGKSSPVDKFSKHMYRQPILTELPQYPEPYRKYGEEESDLLTPKVAVASSTSASSSPSPFDMRMRRLSFSGSASTADMLPLPTTALSELETFPGHNSGTDHSSVDLDLEAISFYRMRSESINIHSLDYEVEDSPEILERYFENIVLKQLCTSERKFRRE